MRIGDAAGSTSAAVSQGSGQTQAALAVVLKGREAYQQQGQAAVALIQDAAAIGRQAGPATVARGPNGLGGGIDARA